MGEHHLPRWDRFPKTATARGTRQSEACSAGGDTLNCRRCITYIFYPKFMVFYEFPNIIQASGKMDGPVKFADRMGWKRHNV
jgi:hypothetical protein